MSLEIQAKFLRTLQTGEIRAVGDMRTRKVSVRIVAATNRNLETAIREATFREDLFYRINTFSITLPPLRERIEDIQFLAEYFLLRARAKVNKKVDSIAPPALALLKRYSWPGNLRELENIIERAVVLASLLRGRCRAPSSSRSRRGGAQAPNRIHAEQGARDRAV
jgi:transcriptional regulator with GAF, ATPase, and Fis domain